MQLNLKYTAVNRLSICFCFVLIDTEISHLIMLPTSWDGRITFKYTHVTHVIS